MSDPVTAAIEGALASATDAGRDESVDTGESVVETSTPESTSTDAPPPSDTPTTSGEPPTTTKGDEIEQMLAAEGFTPRARDETGKFRDNLIPYSRSKKIIENAQKKWAASREEAEKATKAELEKYKGVADQFAYLNNLATNDPERYMAALAASNPAYAAYKRAEAAKEAAEAAQAQVPPATNDPRPQPDATYPDGHKGYSQEGLDALLAWNAREGARQAQKEFNKALEAERKKYEPMQREWEARRAVQAQVPQINAQLQALGKIWGEDKMKASEQDIIAHHREAVRQAMAAKQQPPSLDFSVSAVLLPKMVQDQTAMRESILKELNERKAAATTTTPDATTAEVPEEPKGTEAVIMASIAKARRAGTLR